MLSGLSLLGGGGQRRLEMSACVGDNVPPEGGRAASIPPECPASSPPDAAHPDFRPPPSLGHERPQGEQRREDRPHALEPGLIALVVGFERGGSRHGAHAFRGRDAAPFGGGIQESHLRLETGFPECRESVRRQRHDGSPDERHVARVLWCPMAGPICR